jgi:hypothetical protein
MGFALTLFQAGNSLGEILIESASVFPMKLPHVHSAVIAEAKMVEYLLSPTHRRGKSKAAFFTAHGFGREEWTKLADALRRHAEDNEVSAQTETVFGTRYIIDGTLFSPTGQGLQVRAAWFINVGKDAPRFVTAHPLKRKKT